VTNWTVVTVVTVVTDTFYDNYENASNITSFTIFAYLTLYYPKYDNFLKSGYFLFLVYDR
jgi:hypothetical protein